MSFGLGHVPTDELLRELQRRNVPLAGCRCGKWRAYLGNYDRDGFTLRCFGCKRAVEKCTC